MAEERIELARYSEDELLGLVLLNDASDEQDDAAKEADLICYIDDESDAVETTRRGDRILAELRQLLVGHDDYDRPRALRALADCDPYWADASHAALALHEREKNDGE